MFGHGTAFWANGKEVLHFEGSSTVEIRLTRQVIGEHRATLKADERVELRRAGGDWISVRYVCADDVEFIAELAAWATEAHRPRPGVCAKPPPTGSELERRKRFH